MLLLLITRDSSPEKEGEKGETTHLQNRNDVLQDIKILLIKVVLFEDPEGFVRLEFLAAKRERRKGRQGWRVSSSSPGGKRKKGVHLVSMVIHGTELRKEGVPADGHAPRDAVRVVFVAGAGGDEAQSFGEARVVAAFAGVESTLQAGRRQGRGESAKREEDATEGDGKVTE